MKTSKQEFKACIRTVKKALSGNICHKVFNEACKNNKMIMKAFICNKNRNRENNK